MKPVHPNRPPPQSRVHSQARMAAAALMRIVNTVGPEVSATSTTAAMTRAEMTRGRKPGPTPLATGRAVTPVTSLKLPDRRRQLFLAEVRPQRVDEDELRISGLPEQEVAQPLLTARPDDQVGIGNPRRP